MIAPSLCGGQVVGVSSLVAVAQSDYRPAKQSVRLYARMNRYNSYFLLFCSHSVWFRHSLCLCFPTRSTTGFAQQHR